MEGNLKSLARGSLQSSSSILYSPPAGLRGVVTSFLISNKSSIDLTISIWFVLKSISVPFCPENFLLRAKYTVELIDERIGLEPGDYISGIASLNSQVFFNIHGYEDIL